MKIGVVSDTHSHSLPAQMLKDFAEVDVIIHAGDWCTLADYEILGRVKKVKAVHGNMDEPELVRKLPKRDIVTLDSTRIGLYHGEGAPEHLLERVQEEFEGEGVDIVIFGHSHQAFKKNINGILYFNPGSPTENFDAPYGSYGIIDITKKGITGKIIRVEGK